MKWLLPALWLAFLTVAQADEARVEIRGETLRGYGVLIRYGEFTAILTSAHVWLLNDRPEIVDAKGRKLVFAQAALAAGRDLAMVVCNDLSADLPRRETAPLTSEKKRSETTFYLDAPVAPGDSGSPVYDARKRVTGIVTGIGETGRSFATSVTGEISWHSLDPAEKKRVFALIAELKKGPVPARLAELRREKSSNPALDALLREALEAFGGGKR